MSARGGIRTRLCVFLRLFFLFFSSLLSFFSLLLLSYGGNVRPIRSNSSSSDEVIQRWSFYMDRLPDLFPYGSNGTFVKPRPVVCYKSNWITSDGVWLGDRPLEYSFPLMLLQVSVIFTVSRATHHLLARLGQPRIVSQIVVGVLLGPSVIGRSKAYMNALFPTRGSVVLDTLSLLSLILFLFIIGVKTDLGMLKRSGKKAVATGIVGTFLSFGLSTFITFLLRRHLPTDLRDGHLAILLSWRFSLTSFPVIADALDELKLLNSELGRLVMSATLITDFCNWVLNTIATATILAVHADSPIRSFWSVASFVGFFLFVVFVARPATLWIVRRTPEGEPLNEAYVLLVIVAALLSAFVTEVLGYSPTLGSFLLGLALPGGAPLGVTLAERLDSLVSGLFLPIYFVLAGYRTDVSVVNDRATLGYLALVIVLNFVGKLVGSMVPTIFYKMPFRDALSVGLMMNIKGIVEISFLNNWADDQIATAEHFTIILLSILLMTVVTTPMIKALYKPSERYVAYKRRTIQHAKRDADLRILACVHNEDHVPAIIDLLEASVATKETPICVYVLHLVQLVGRAAAVLAPHKNNKKRSSTNTTPTDRIVNSFRYYEKMHPESVTLHPFVGISPYATMHNDVCSLAMEAKATLVIVPFHKQFAPTGSVELTNQAFQNVNHNVLDYAPCSVAILVDHGLTGGITCSRTNNLLQRIAVYFLGGADDREALAYAMRMAGNPGISITVSRFLPPKELREDDAEAKLDEEMLDGFRIRYVDSKRIRYREEVVEDGEGTIGLIRSMSPAFDLLMVGRRKGLESPLTTGFSIWSEYPELGVIGDMLASTELGGKVSILVVQQQARVGETAAEGGPKRRSGFASILTSNVEPAEQLEEVKDVLIHREM